MRNKIDDCSEEKKDIIVMVEENGMKFYAKNPLGRLVKKIRIDGCVVTDSRQRCDFLLEIESPCICAIYIELKGCDVNKAVDQIISTLEILKEEHKNVKKICCVVCTRVPKAGPSVQILKRTMNRKYGVQLYVDTRQASRNIEDVLSSTNNQNA